MPDLGKAYVQIVPSAEGISGSISDVLSGEATSAGQSAGGLFGSSLVSTISGIVAAAGIGKFIGDSISTGMDFDKSMSQVAATMGISMDEMAESVGTVDLAWGTFSGNLREYAQEMGANTAFSATEAADALNYMALAGYDAQTSMEMLPNVLNLAAAGDIALATASDMVTDASSALGLDISQTADMVDQMAKASSKSNTSVAQLGDAFLTVGGTAKSLTGGTTELSTALGIMADSGIKGSEAGTHMRNILLALNPTTDKAVAAFEELGINAYDADGNLKPLNETFTEMSAALDSYTDQGRQDLISKMFNKTDLSAVDALLSAAKYDVEGLTSSLASSGIEWGNYGDKLGEFEGSMEDVAQSVSDWIMQGTEEEYILERLRGCYGLTADDAVTAFETIKQGMDDQGNRWTELAGYISDADGAAQQMADTQLDNLAGDITLFQSALEGVKIAISDFLAPSLREVVQLGAELMSGITAALNDGDMSGLMDLGTKIMDMLLEGIASAPSRMLAGLEMIQGVIEGVMQNLPLLGDNGTQAVDGFLGGLVEGMAKVYEKAGEIITELVNGFIAAAPSLISAAGALMASFTGYLLDNATDLLTAGAGMIDRIMQGISAKLPAIADSAKQAFSKFLNTITEKLPDLLAAGVELLTNLANGILSNLPTLISTALELITTFVKFILENLPTILQAGADLLLNLVDGIVSNLPEIATAAYQGILQFQLTILSMLPDIWQKGIEIIGQLVAGLIEAIPKIIAAIPQIIAGVTETLMEFDWAGTGMDIINGIAEGIKNAGSSILNALWDAVSSAIDWVKKKLGIESPSKYMADMVGKNMALGIGEGFEDNIPDTEMADAVLNTTYAMETATENGISEAANGISYEAIYEAVKAGAEAANLVIDLDGRELTRRLKGLGVAMA